jgi:hypothetical protein
MDCLTREQEDAAIAVFETEGLEPSERALRVVEAVYGAQARRWVSWRARNGYRPGWSGSWPEDLGIALEYYADRVTEPLARQVKGQWREGPGRQLHVLEEQLAMAKRILLADAKVWMEAS